ncbi:hypothetical protein D3C81_769040 [compost metagenome]
MALKCSEVNITHRSLVTLANAHALRTASDIGSRYLMYPQVTTRGIDYLGIHHTRQLIFFEASEGIRLHEFAFDLKRH